jgi:hypothetical protein
MKSGGVAQLGERLPCTQEVIGSIPFTSTNSSGVGRLFPTGRDSPPPFFGGMELAVEKPANIPGKEFAGFLVFSSR